MMMPSMSASSSSSHGVGVSVSSVMTRVEKATSEFLIGPDWTMNIDICDTINSNHWLSKDVVKAVKRRVLHKNPKVQLLSLTLLETMVKNCGDYVHFQIVDRNILPEMVKVIKKKTDMRVRDKMLILLDSWQEAFGGPGGKYPQYYWAYEELRRMGVSFPERPPNTAPIFTPPLTHPPIRHPQPGYGMPNNSSKRLDEAMAAEETLSLSSLRSMKDVLDLLDDMLKAIDPTNPASVKDEVIVDLVEQCIKNQKKLMEMLGSTGDEELLTQGLELNDNIQNVFAKHHAIESGAPLPEQVANFFSKDKKEDSSSSPKPADATTPTKSSNGDTLPPVVPTSENLIDEEEEEEDDFALLARRHSKTNSSASQSSLLPNGETQSNGSFEESSSASVAENALVVVDPPAPTRSSKEQDIIDLLSITLLDTPSTQSTSSAPTPSDQSFHDGATPTRHENNPVAPQAQSFNSYVAPWAVPQNQPQHQQQYQQQHQQQYQQQHQQQYQQQPYQPPQQYPQYYGQAQARPQLQPQYQPATPQYSAYPPPPWAATPGYYSNPTPVSNNGYSHAAAQGSSLVPVSSQLQQPWSSPPVAASNAPGGGGGQKPFVPSYRLFEDLNVLGNSTDARFKTNSSSLSGGRMVGGGK